MHYVHVSDVHPVIYYYGPYGCYLHADFQHNIPMDQITMSALAMLFFPMGLANDQDLSGSKVGSIPDHPSSADRDHGSA